MKIISINADNTMKEINIKNKKIKNELTDITNTRGSGDIELLYYWNYNNNKILCYGWIDGDESLINKHKLPISGISEITDISSETIKLYGNIYIICNCNNKTINYSISEYGEFYFIINDIENIVDTNSDNDEDDGDDGDDGDCGIENNNDNGLLLNDDGEEDDNLIPDFDYTDTNYDYKENKIKNKDKIKQIDVITKISYKDKSKVILNELDLDNNTY